MTEPVRLRGIAWAHTRATGPLHVTAQAFADLHPGCEIRWEQRSLWAFGEASLDGLAQDYDLLVIDHPMIGHAVSHGLLAQLDGLVTADWLAEQAAGSVGGSHESYRYQGGQWAAAIDAACPVCIARDDLLAAAGEQRPSDWTAVLELARRTHRVAVPLKAIDALSLFFTLCANQGEAPLNTQTATVVSDDLGLHVLDQLAELLELVNRRCLDANPIDILTSMSTRDEILFCPHAYGYTNYSRAGFAPSRVAFHDFPGPQSPRHAGTTLGGAGLAISAHATEQALAAEYLQFVASPECQRSTYVLAGGQPGHAAAWDDDLANVVTGGFFRQTRRTIDASYVRPRHAGMHDFQAAAGASLRAFLHGEQDAARTLDALGEHFRTSCATVDV